MGWLIWNKSPSVKPLDELRSRDTAWWDAKVVKAAYTFNAAWMVVKGNVATDTWGAAYYVPDADGTFRSILVFKLYNAPKKKGWENFGYKDMSETSGPYGLEAPAAIIKAASPLKPLTPEEAAKEYSGLKSAHAYRERSLAKAELNKARAKIKVGSKVTLAKPLNFGGVLVGNFTAAKGRVRGRKGLSLYFVGDNGGNYRLTASNLAGATIS